MRTLLLPLVKLSRAVGACVIALLLAGWPLTPARANAVEVRLVAADWLD